MLRAVIDRIPLVAIIVALGWFVYNMFILWK